jgi:hypothetical protein
MSSLSWNQSSINRKRRCPTKFIDVIKYTPILLGALAMKTALIIVGSVIAALVAFVVYRYIKVIRLGIKQSRMRDERVKALLDKFESGKEVTHDDVLPFAEALRTRESTYKLLSDRDRLDLFPEHHVTIESGAAGNLANWLEFPTELDTCPDEMEHIGRHTFVHDGRNFHYEVFKYRIGEPHWAAANGWMLGAAGPYFDDSKPYDFPSGTFSRCSSTVDNQSAEDEARWIHENIGLR